ncbi:MAG TPA: gamma-glutamyltransferase, partial [Bryobacteraceae bacterium]|nr:gamma-glutamyltransferase [Bryobacteraceae bacterium]
MRRRDFCLKSVSTAGALGFAAAPAPAQQTRDEREEQYRGFAGRSQARSMVISPLGIAATSQALASQAGAQVLARGGSAVDAAIAANAALGVVEPMMNGIGGDLFALVWEAKTGKLTGINASGWAPARLTIDFLKSQGASTMPHAGIHSVSVPGCVAGWDQLHRRFGRLPWKDLFQPAIYFATNGFPVTELIQAAWNGQTAKLQADPNGRRLFLDHGNAARVGQIFHNSELAGALK